MSKRLLSLIAVVALLAAACGGSAESTTTTPAPETTAVPAVEAVLLSYTLSPGDEFHYRVSIEQHIEMTAEGDEAMMSEEEMPGSASIDLTGTGTFTQTVSDGPSEGTHEVHITGEFSDVSVTGTVDGEPVDSSEIPDFAEMEPVDVTVVVDEQGNLVQDGATGEDMLGSDLFGLGGMGGDGFVPGLDLGRFIGIPLPDQEVTVGDTWTEEIETPGMMDVEPIVTTVTSEVTGVEEAGGVQLFVIETDTTTSPIEFDLAQFFAGMLGAFTPEGASEAEQAEMEAALADLRFLISVDESTSESTTRFDPEAGLARQVDSTSATNIAMDINFPDEATGEMQGFVMNMSLDQDISFELTSGPTA
jgi:hypothetical protein